MANITGYKFSNKCHSGKGMLSLGFGAASLIMLLALIYWASIKQGNGSIYLGTIGLVSLVFSVIGLVIGLISFFELNRYKLFPKIGSIFNIIMLLIWTSIVMIGV